MAFSSRDAPALADPHPLAHNRVGAEVRYYEFTERPLSDSCWSLHTGPDQRIYAAACCEHTGGETATVVRYDKASDSFEYLFDVDRVTGDLRDSGRATQCKIHYSFAPEARTGMLYAATHLSGPPIGERHYNPLASWHDPQRAFAGAQLVAFNTRTDQVEWARLMIPKEGCRCLAFDPARRRLYALTYPRDHLVWYDLDRHELHDLGRLGSINSQAIVTDRRGRVFTFEDRGRMVRYDPDRDALETLDHVFPHHPCQSGWHGIIYDAVEDPESGAIYLSPWKGRPHLARYWPEDGPDGRIEDLGPMTQPFPTDRPVGVNVDHVGGLAFGSDGKLYYVRSRWDFEQMRQRGRPSSADSIAELCTYDPASGDHEPLLTLADGTGMHHYISRAACDGDGDLYFGKILARPAGVYRVRGLGLGAMPLRTWG